MKLSFFLSFWCREEGCCFKNKPVNSFNETQGKDRAYKDPEQEDHAGGERLEVREIHYCEDCEESCESERKISCSTVIDCVVNDD